MNRTWLTVLPALWLALALPQGACAAGGPVAPVQGSYIGVPGSQYRYAAFGANGTTVVMRQAADAGPAAPELRVRGRYGVPGVDYGGSTTGLSADGRTLILAELPGSAPPRRTRLLVLDAPRLSVRARLTLPGWSTVDAISPNGRWLYLIHYRSPDVSRYEVQAYDLLAGRLLAKPVVDARDRGEAMTGFPLNRVMSADRRWAYTLYYRPSGVPFVHALDTAGRRAVCIDLPSLSSMDAGSAHLGLAPGGATLQVDAGGLQAVIDTRSFAVGTGGDHSAAAPARPVAHRHRGARRQDNVPWELIVLSIAMLGALAGAGGAVARSKRHPDDGRAPEVTIVTDAEPGRTDRARTASSRSG